MAAFTGGALYVSFGGTVLNADYRSFEPEGEIGLEDGSAGADVGRTFKKTLKDGNASLTLRSIAGTAGTAKWVSLYEGAEGTLVWGPEGTATGASKGSVYAIIENRSNPQEYDQVAEWTFSFKYSDAAGVVYSTW